MKQSSPIADLSNILEPKDRSAWRDWLEENHETSSGIWVTVHNRRSKNPLLILEDAVEEAICFGWIDSRLHELDENRYNLWFTRRKPTSIWSQNNRNRVAKLEAQGLMTPAGMAVVEIAKENGAWTSLVPIDNLEIPDDLKEALDADVDARNNFETFNDSTKKMILHWIDTAKRSDTRKKRINETVKQAAKNQSPYR